MYLVLYLQLPPSPQCQPPPPPAGFPWLARLCPVGEGSRWGSRGSTAPDTSGTRLRGALAAGGPQITINCFQCHASQRYVQNEVRYLLAANENKCLEPVFL